MGTTSDQEKLLMVEIESDSKLCIDAIKRPAAGTSWQSGAILDDIKSMASNLGECSFHLGS